MYLRENVIFTHDLLEKEAFSFHLYYFSFHLRFWFSYVVSFLYLNVNVPEGNTVYK